MKADSNNWINSQEVEFFKTWQKLQIKLHWINHRLNSHVDNDHTELWKRLRK